MLSAPEPQGPDLVVVGAGAGLVAALRAAQLGLDVLVVETSKDFSRGNNTAMSTAMVPGAGTRWQAQAGIKDAPEIFVADIIAKTKGTVDHDLAEALATVSARLVTWLADDLKLPISLVTDFPYPGHSQLRCHTVPGRSGRALLSGLVAAMRADEHITMLIPARLTDVRVGPGGVQAVEVTTPDGRTEIIPTRAVLLATNGFGANAALVRKHIPEIATAIYHGSAESKGDALTIGIALGADTAFLDAYQGHAAVAVPAATLAGWATVMHGGFLVNDAGHRFGDETVGYSEYAREVLIHADGHAVIVLDQRIHDACLAFDDFRDTVQSGSVQWADNIESLATAMGIDAAGLVATIVEVSEFAHGDGSDRFGRTDWEAPLSPPYAAIHVAPALFHTQGGLRVDAHARVLTADGSTIRGLYASGGAAMGISGHGASGYLAGNGLLPALGLAFLAAEDVAAQTVATEPRTKS